jgi:predicted ester cyclase
MSEKSKAVVERYFAELDRGRATPVDMCTEDFVFHVAGFDAMTLEQAKEFGDVFFRGLPDLHHPLGDLIAEGDRVAFRCRYEGTHTEEFMGIPPTGNRVSFEGIAIMRVDGDRIAEFWVSPDRTTMMQQVGAAA